MPRRVKKKTTFGRFCDIISVINSNYIFMPPGRRSRRRMRAARAVMRPGRRGRRPVVQAGGPGPRRRGGPGAFGVVVVVMALIVIGFLIVKYLNRAGAL